MNRKGVRNSAMLTLSLACGLGVGWSLREDAAGAGTRERSGTTTTTKDVARPDRPHLRAADQGPAHDLAALKRMMVPQGELPVEARAALLRMNPDTLRELMRKVAAEKPGADGTAGRAWQVALLTEAAREMCRRDLRASLDWALGIYRQSPSPKRGTSSRESEPAEVAILSKMMNAAERQDLPETKMWQAGCSTEDKMAMILWSGCYGGVPPAESDVDIATVRKQQQEMEWSDALMREGFPAGFDFSRLFAYTGEEWVLRGAATYWAALDPEAAYAGVKDLLAEKPQLWGRLAAGVANRSGDAVAAAWVAEKMAGLPAAERVQAVGNLSQIDTVERVEAFMAVLGGDAERVAFAKAALKDSPGGYDPKRADVRALELLGSEDLQVRALSEVMKERDTTPDVVRISAKLKLSPQALEKLEEAKRGVPEG